MLQHSICSFTNLQYCTDNMFLLCCSLNLSLNTLNSPVLVLHFPALHCLESVKSESHPG